jgi:hypothetical protein
MLRCTIILDPHHAKKKSFESQEQGGGGFKRARTSGAQRVRMRNQQVFYLSTWNFCSTPTAAWDESMISRVLEGCSSQPVACAGHDADTGTDTYNLVYNGGKNLISSVPGWLLGDAWFSLD